MSQVLAQPFDCKTCGQQIRLSKIDNVAPDAKKKWNKFELDGVTVHVCTKKQQSQQPPVLSRTTSSTDISKEIAAIKAQLLVLVSRLDRLEQELQK
jgi:uncharacterized protein (UPF0335 family)